MFPFGQHPIYKHTEEERRVVLQNVELTEEKVKAGSEAIQTWMEKQPHLADAGIDSRMADMYIVMAKGSVERAKQRLDFYYKEKDNYPEVQGRIKLLNDCKPVWERFAMYQVPKLYNGSRITCMKIYDWSSSVEEMCVAASMLYDIRLHNDFWSGETWVFDLKNATLTDILSLNYLSLSRAYKQLLKEGLGIRINQIYLINCTVASIAQVLLNILKSFLSRKLLGRLQFYETEEGLKEHIPKEYLPADYGGDLPPFKVHTEKMEEMIASEKTKQFLLQILNVKSDERKRPKMEYNENDIQGHFKKLDID